jgi:signal transduction histidine kinase
VAGTVIDPRPTSPPGRSYPDRSRSSQAAEVLPGLLEALPVGIGLFAAWDDEFTFCCGNREFARVLGLKRIPRDGEPVGEVFDRAEHDAIIELFRRVRANRDPQSYFASEAGGSRANRIWNIDAYPVFNGGRLSHIMVLVEQTTEKFEARQRHQHEENRLREKADQLGELEKAKSEFLRLASHELRGPAAMLGGYLSMIEDESLGPIPERLRLVLPLLRAKAAQINMLANEMVEAARLEDRRLQLKRKHLDLRAVLRRSVQRARASATAKHRLRFDDQAGGEVPVLADVMRLDIIVDNLIDNAIKYSPDGGDVTVQLSVAGELALVSVRDVGIGIAPEDMERLFVRFNRLAPQANVPGTGLGLYLARELARLHGGDIIAVSKPGAGSEFTLSLPLEHATT